MSPDSSGFTFASGDVLQCRVAYNRFGGFCVPESSLHRPAAIKILSGEVHEPETLQLLVEHCKSGDIVHAGTFFGDFLPALSDAAGSEHTVWAFEPNYESYRCAQITSMINGLRNVQLTHAGLGESVETGFLRTTDEAGRALGGASEIVAGNAGMSNDHSLQSVAVTTVDHVIPAQRRIGIIQLDVEGYEQQALAGALATIRRCRPVLVLEVLPGSDLLAGSWFRENILDAGYREAGKVHENFVFTYENSRYRLKKSPQKADEKLITEGL